MAQTILKVTDRDNIEQDLSMVQDASNSNALVSASIPCDPTSGAKGKVSAAGELAIGSVAQSNATLTAYAASLIVKAAAGRLFGFSGYNSGPAQFIQVHDSATLPADGGVPKIVIEVPTQTNFSWDGGIYGRSFAAGIVICCSTTGPTKTIGSANTWIDAQFA